MDVQRLQHVLDLFAGGYARLWDFSPSHDRLVIELTDREHENTAYLIVLGTTHIRAQTAWRGERLQISMQDDGMLLCDEEVETRFVYEARVQDDYSP